MTVSSSQFFAAVSSKRYDELIQMYGHAAIEALQNYQNVQMRWNSRERNHIPRISRGTGVDDDTSLFFWKAVMSTQTCFAYHVYFSFALDSKQKKNSTNRSPIPSLRDIHLLELATRTAVLCMLLQEGYIGVVAPKVSPLVEIYYESFLPFYFIPSKVKKHRKPNRHLHRHHNNGTLDR